MDPPRDPAGISELTQAMPVGQTVGPTCSVCGTTLAPGETTSSLCPVCVLRGALDPDEAGQRPAVDQDLSTEAGPGPGRLNPRRFGHYEILTDPAGNLVELGRGAMGLTFKALDLNLRVPVTLKVLNLRLFEDERARRRFLREARSAATVRHPNVASVYHLGARGREFFYAMEFVEGETLERIVKRRGSLEVKLALQIAVQVAAGLAAVHKQNLVHRDIKPSNIMVNLGKEDGPMVKIIDLGLAKTVNEPHTETAISVHGTFAGTPEYASPEQFAGTGVDIRSDLYSLGVTLWNMLAGQAPYKGTVFAVAHQHQFTPLPIQQLAGVPQPVVALLETMLEKDPAKRFQTPAEFLEAIPKVSHAIETGRRVRGALRDEPEVKPVRVRTAPVKLSAHELYLQGVALVELNDRAANQKAIRIFKKAIKQDPNCASAYAGLARAYVEEQGFGGEKFLLDSAVEAARIAVALNPREPLAYHALGHAYFLKGWDPQCDQAIEKALQICPEDDRVNAIAALRALARHQFAESYQFFRKAMSINPGITWRIYNAAEILFRAGLNDVADRWMQHALDRETNPQSHRMMQCYATMWRGKLAAARAGFALLPPKLQSSNYSVFDGLLHCSVGLNDWPAVIQSCNAYLKTDPDKLWVRTYLALALERSGQEAEARKWIDQILERGLERLERPGQPDVPWDMALHIAWAYRCLDREDETYRYLHTYLAHRTLIQIPLGFANPILDCFKGEPEFDAIAADLNRKFAVAGKLIREQETGPMGG